MAISHNFVQGPPDSTGKKLHTVVVDTDKHRETVAIGGPDAADLDAIGVVVNSAPGASAYAPASRVGDGHNVVEGATADAAVTTDTTGTLSGKLRGLIKWAFERMPASLGQKAMAASLGVVIASDQSAVPVSGTVTANAGTNLNTSALALEATLGTRLADATFTTRINTQGQKAMAASTPVVIASDQSAVPVSGPLTDAQLRATPVPVSATNLDVRDLSFAQDSVSNVPAYPARTASGPAAATVGVASAAVVSTNANRKGLVLTNLSNNRISFAVGTPAVLDQGITLYPGGVWEMDEFTFATGEIRAIASAASSPLAIQEFTT